MIVGVGIDLVSIDRLEQALERWGQRFLERVFTAAEIERCRGRARTAHCLALRFAAKEAFAKALGQGFRQGLCWRDIEVVAAEFGKPALRLHRQAQRLLEVAGGRRAWVSLSDEGGFAVALVLLEG